MVKNFVKTLTTAQDVILQSGIASGYLVAEHIIVNKNGLPDLVFGKGPTQSTITCSKGSPMTGIGIKGAGGITWFGFPAYWQT